MNDAADWRLRCRDAALPAFLPFPPALQAPGTDGAPFEAVASLADLPLGSMLRVTRGDLDVLLVHSDAGIAAVDDRCPHMSAPFSVGRLEGCVLHCPLHRGAFDLRDGEVVTFPTTGGLTADGDYRPTWTPEGGHAAAAALRSQGASTGADARAALALLPAADRRWRDRDRTARR